VGASRRRLRAARVPVARDSASSCSARSCNVQRSIDLQYRRCAARPSRPRRKRAQIAANEQHARQEAFLRLSRLIHQQLGVRAGCSFVSSQPRGASRGRSRDAPEQSQAMWSALGSGDEHVFARAMMGLHFQRGGPRLLALSGPRRSAPATRHLPRGVRPHARARARLRHGRPARRDAARQHERAALSRDPADARLRPRQLERRPSGPLAARSPNSIQSRRAPAERGATPC